MIASVSDSFSKISTYTNTVILRLNGSQYYGREDRVYSLKNQQKNM